MVVALIYAVANVLPKGNLVFAASATFLAGVGILLSTLWALVQWRTTSAQLLWREAARELERVAPPVDPRIPAEIPVRPGRFVTVDISRPYSAHRERFSPANDIPWVDRVSPVQLTNQLPVLLIATWAIVLVAVWILVMVRGP